MKIEVGKTYLVANGGKTRIVVGDVNSIHSGYTFLGLETSAGSHFEVSRLYDANGFLLGTPSGAGNLIREVTPWDDFKFDEPVIVTVSRSNTPIKRHFAYVKDGKPWCWDNGRTSFTTVETSCWEYCERAPKE